MKILAFAASTSTKSINTQLASYAASHLASLYQDDVQLIIIHID